MTLKHREGAPGYSPTAEQKVDAMGKVTVELPPYVAPGSGSPETRRRAPALVRALCCTAGVDWGYAPYPGRSPVMHTLKLFRRRFPTGYAVIVVMLFLLTLALLVVGIGMLFVR